MLEVRNVGGPGGAGLGEVDYERFATAGFSREEADAYARAYCSDPHVARRLQSAGLTAEMAAQRVGDRPQDTVAYWVEIGAFSVEDAVEEVGVLVYEEFLM